MLPLDFRCSSSGSAVVGSVVEVSFGTASVETGCAVAVSSSGGFVVAAESAEPGRLVLAASIGDAVADTDWNGRAVFATANSAISPLYVPTLVAMDVCDI